VRQVRPTSEPKSMEPETRWIVVDTAATDGRIKVMAKVGKYRYIEPEAVAKLGRLNIVARAVVEGFITGLHRSPYHGFSVEFSDHRKYVPGDNLRDLDWKTLARTDRYYIKQYEEETNLRCTILLDASASMGFGGGELTKLEYGCYMAASLAYMMVRQQDSVGLVVFDKNVREFLPPRSSTPHLNLLLQSLEDIGPGELTDLAETFHNLAQRIKRRGLIVIISDLYHGPEKNREGEFEAVPRDVIRALSHFRHKRHEVLLFHVMDPAELELPFRRLSDFVDLETGERVQVDPRYAREEYVRLVNEEFIGGYRRECVTQNIDYVQVDTSMPYDLMLQRYLSKRKRLS